MGTNATIDVYDYDFCGKEIPITRIYSQFDGYIDQNMGVCHDLLEFCKDAFVVNGFTKADENTHNGAGCFAASLVKFLKETTGTIYLMPCVDRRCDYRYEVFVSHEKPIVIKCYDFDGLIFKGTVEDLREWIQDCYDEDLDQWKTFIDNKIGWIN